MKVYLKQYFGFSDIQVSILLFLGGLIYTAFWYQHGAVYAALGVGVFLYITSEYFTHRFLFHMSPPKHGQLLKLMKRLHYDHHRDPSDLHLLFLPIWYSLPMFVIVVIVVEALTKSSHLTVAVATGAIATLLYYEWIHFVAHRPIIPLTPWGKWMKKIHLWHHFKNEHYWFGVTSPLYDVVMHTFPDEKSVDRSTSVRDLENHDFLNY